MSYTLGGELNYYAILTCESGALMLNVSSFASRFVYILFLDKRKNM